DPGDRDVSFDLERLPLAAHRPDGRVALHASRLPRDPLRGARPGHGADDGGLRLDRPARAAPLPRPAALLHRRHPDRRRQGVIRLSWLGLLLFLTAAAAPET